MFQQYLAPVPQRVGLTCVFQRYLQAMSQWVGDLSVSQYLESVSQWVAVTCVFQLEGQNSLLVRENAELQAQVLTLRQRLLSLPANAAKEIYRLSIQVGLCWML